MIPKYFYLPEDLLQIIFNTIPMNMGKGTLEAVNDETIRKSDAG